MRKINKSGKMGAGTKVLMALGGIAIIVFMLAQFGLLQDITGDAGGVGGVEGCADSTTTLTFPAKNFYSLSSSVSVTPYGRITAIGEEASDLVNLSSVGAIGVGSKITDIFYSASNYIDTEADDFVVKCGQTLAPSVKIKPTDDPNTFLVKNDAGTTLGDQSSEGALENASSTAGTLELELRIGAIADVTTGDLVLVVEYDNSTQADSISVTGATDATTPEIYSAEATASLVKAFNLPATEDGNTDSYTVKIQPESGETLGAVLSAIRFQIYSKQAFEDVDGTVQVGVEDSDGTLKYEDEGDYDVTVV